MTATEVWRHSTRVSLALLALAGVALVLFIVRERRAGAPLVPHTMWSDRWFVSGLVGAFGVTATTSPFVIVATLWFQDERGYSPAAAGLLVLPFSLTVVTAAALAGRFMPRIGARPALLVGLTVIAVGITSSILSTTMLVLVAAMVATGAGNAVASVASYALGTQGPPEHHASAAGLLNTAGQTGTAIAVAIAFAVAQTTAGRVDYHLGWSVAAAAGVICIAAVGLRSR